MSMSGRRVTLCGQVYHMQKLGHPFLSGLVRLAKAAAWFARESKASPTGLPVHERAPGNVSHSHDGPRPEGFGVSVITSVPQHPACDQSHVPTQLLIYGNAIVDMLKTEK